jgi:copper chaperone CopZ
MKLKLSLQAVVLVLAVGLTAWAQSSQTVTYRLVGLYCESREDDLRQTVQKGSGIRVKSVSFRTGEATLSFQGRAPGPEQLDKILRPAYFRVKGVVGVEASRLKRVEIGVVGMDCKGCSLAVYDVLVKIEGVEHAIVDFREGRVTALIDPSKTSRDALVQLLKKHRLLAPNEASAG